MCSFAFEITLKILKIKNKNEYEEIQIINNSHNDKITKIIELKNENLISISKDHCFKIWKLDKNNYKYEKIKEFKDIEKLNDGLEIKDNEILYSLITNPQSLVFFDLNKFEKIKTLKNLNLFNITVGCKLVKLNNNEVAVAGSKKVYLIDITNYTILHAINCENKNICILKLSNNLFLTGNENGTITQYIIENKKIIKESFKNNLHKDKICSMTLINDMIIFGGYKSHKINIWINNKNKLLF